MKFWNNPENNSIKVLVLVAVIAVAGYFAYSNVQGDPLKNTGAVTSTTSKKSACGTVALAMAPDPTFTATTVNSATPNNVIGRFIISNPTKCSVALKTIVFSLPVSTPTGKASALRDIRVMSGGMQFGKTLSLTGPAPAYQMPFASVTLSGLAVPAGSSVTVEVVSGVAFGTAGGTFQVQMFRLAGYEIGTGVLYAWLHTSGPKILSNLLTIL